ncbi:hypothetical protein B296_00053797, partial [Ensete ventricosum]
QVEDAGRRQKKTKVLTRKHKSRVGEGEPRSRLKGKEPAALSEEPEEPAGSEGGASLARWTGLKNSTKVWNNSSAVEEFGRGLLYPQLARELYTLPSELDALKSKGGPEAVAEAEERASVLREELKKIKGEKAEELLRREASEKELLAVWGHLGDAQQLLKETRTRARRMDDELLQAVKDLKSARAELLGQVVSRYKGSLGFKEGLKRMGRVTYEYGYRVVLARFRRFGSSDSSRTPSAEWVFRVLSSGLGGMAPNGSVLGLLNNVVAVK